MYDPRGMYPGWYHPLFRDENWERTKKAKRRSRTDHPVKYYFVSFSRAYRYWNIPRPLEAPLPDKNMTIGQLQNTDNDKEVDPFTTDIRALGRMVQSMILTVRSSLARRVFHNAF